VVSGRSNGRALGCRLWRLGLLLVLALYAAPSAAAPRGNETSKKASAQVARAKPRTAAAPARAAPSAAAAPSASPAPRAAAEAQVEGGAKDEAKAAVVDTDVKAGVKTYTFDAQEVEGRLRSPQILYFLRRVRAQFDPAPLGHRSFMLELSDTRRHPSLK
jgi:hypothetical protein